MRKKQALLLCTACALLAILALLAYKPAPREPIYDGHPLSDWVVALATDATPKEGAPAPTYAIDKIGPAAIPYLLKWTQYERPRWRQNLCTWLDRRAYTLTRELASMLADKRADLLASGTSAAFNVLGPRAMPALDDLCRLMNDTNRPSTALRATGALAYLGTNALPQLEAAATNANYPINLAALDAVRKIRLRELAAVTLTNAPPPPSR
jgi:hypothetical protein